MNIASRSAIDNLEKYIKDHKPPTKQDMYETAKTFLKNNMMTIDNLLTIHQLLCDISKIKFPGVINGITRFDIRPHTVTDTGYFELTFKSDKVSYEYRSDKNSTQSIFALEFKRLKAPTKTETIRMRCIWLGDKNQVMDIMTTKEINVPYIDKDVTLNKVTIPVNLPIDIETMPQLAIGVFDKMDKNMAHYCSEIETYTYTLD